MPDKMINVKFSKKTLEDISKESEKIGLTKGAFIRMAVMKYIAKIKNSVSGE